MPSRDKGRPSGGGARQGASSPPSLPAATSAKPKPGAPWTAAQWLAAIPPVLSSLGVELSAAQQAQLAAYMAMLAHWNSTFNLTALRDPQEMVTHHLADCLAVLAPLARRLPPKEGDAAARLPHLLDVGSGGGLPGVVLAIARPDLRVTCVDTVGKKAAFIRQAAAELRLPNLRAEHARVEQLHGQFELITSRAFASLTNFVSLTQDLLAQNGVWMAMKGKPPEDEMKALPDSVEVFHVEQLQVPELEAQRCIVWMRKKNAG